MLQSPHFGQKSIVQNADVRPLQPRRGKHVDNLIARDNRFRNQLPHRRIDLFRRLAAPPTALAQRRPHGLEKRNIVPNRRCLIASRTQRERLRQAPHHLHEPPLPVLLLQNMLLRPRQQTQPLSAVQGPYLDPFNPQTKYFRPSFLSQ